MRRLLRAALVVTTGVPWLIVAAIAATPASPVTPAFAQATAAETATVPMYVPPRRGAPGGRVGGGTRGIGHEALVLSVLAPADHAGLTVEEQPTLYWFISRVPAVPIELTVSTDGGTQPVLETRLAAPATAGVQRTRLADHGVRLVPGVRYRWFVTAVADPDRRSRDVLAGGMIERVEAAETLRARLAGADPTRRAFLLAEEGLWYDAIATISDLIERSPHDATRRRQRAGLLEQVGLRDVADYDVKQAR
jgi:hypothetical protein